MFNPLFFQMLFSMSKDPILLFLFFTFVTRLNDKFFLNGLILPDLIELRTLDYGMFRRM